LGIVVSVTLKLVRVKPYVHMKYIPCFSLGELEKRVGDLLRGPAADFPDYLEATLYSPSTAVIQAGYLSDYSPKLPVNRISRWFKPWFYKHVEQALFREEVVEELLPLRDYYHRHTKSIYWELEDMVPFANHPIYRWLLGWLGAPKVSLVKLTQGVAVRRATLYKHVCQEFMVPLKRLSELHNLYANEFHTYPLLLYIIRIYDLATPGDKQPLGQGFIRAPEAADKEPQSNFAYFAELGAYGVPAAVRRQTVWDAHAAVRLCERFARACNGYQCLCFDTLQTEKEFEKMFDHRLWRSVRQRYNLETAFPSVYSKVVPEAGVL
jgi:delta24-sterol reductase